MPLRLSLPDRTLDLAHEETVDSFDHSGGKVAFPGQRLSPWQSVDLLAGAAISEQCDEAPHEGRAETRNNAG